MKVNFLKIVLIGIRIGELQIEAFANLAGVKVGFFWLPIWDLLLVLFPCLELCVTH